MADWGFVVIMSIVPRRRRRTVPGLLVLVVISLTAACGGDDDGTAPDPTPRSTTTTTEPTTTTLSELDQKIEAAKAAYLAYGHAYRTAATAPVTPHLAEVQAVMTGLQQSQITANLEGFQARGEATRLPPNSQERDEFLDAQLQPDGSVLLKTCSVNDAIVYNVATGTVINDNVVTAAIDVTMVEEGGAWKVADSVVTARWDGVVPCEG